MKKIILFCLVSCMLFSLCACGSSEGGTFESNLKESTQTGTTTNVEDAHNHESTSDSTVSPDTEVITPTRSQRVRHD